MALREMDEGLPLPTNTTHVHLHLNIQPCRCASDSLHYITMFVLVIAGLLLTIQLCTKWD